MPHHVYNTRGFILGSVPVREADKLFIILTPDLGLVRAMARGVRRERSRLRGFLSDYALVDVSLVRGASQWRLTTAALVRDNTYELRDHTDALRSLAKVVSLLQKLIHGEEAHQDLFALLAERVSGLIQGEPAEAWEIFMVSHILFYLGYLSKEHVPESLHEAAEKKRAYVSVINEGIRMSGLV